MVTELAQALNTPVPEILNQPDYPTNARIARGAPSMRRGGGFVMATFRNVFLFLLIILLAVSTLGALFVFFHKQTDTASTTTSIVGHVYFLSSGRLFVVNNQGLNDEALIDLHNLAAPASGQSYYAWLLGDASQSEVPWVTLGKSASTMVLCVFFIQATKPVPTCSMTWPFPPDRRVCRYDAE
jgi:hypothetical protein